MKILKIKEYELLVDDEDYERLVSIPWSVQVSHGHPYARATIKVGSKYRTIRLHRFILNAYYKDGIIVDHINGNTLDNRKENLRKCSSQENSLNRGYYKNNSTGFKGVYFKNDHKRKKPWYAIITVNKKRVPLGFFSTPEEASSRYQESAKVYFGEFSRMIKGDI